MCLSLIIVHFSAKYEKETLIIILYVHFCTLFDWFGISNKLSCLPVGIVVGEESPLQHLVGAATQQTLTTP